MLSSLHVHNFALIEDAIIEFTSGFNVFTGETGAGKSILIDAFSIVLGNRASTDYIRSGADSYWVQAVFDISGQKNILGLLEEIGIENQEDTLFLRRRVLAGGKSQATVNGIMVPVNILSKIAERLVDIHGQHENQQLLRQGAPLEMIDVYGGPGLQTVLNDYQKIYKEHEIAAQEFAGLLEQNTNQQEIIERLQTEITEIENAHIIAKEDEILREQVQKLNNSGKILEAVNLAHKLLDGDEHKEGILDVMTEARAAVDKVREFDPTLQGVYDGIDNAWLTLEDVRQTLGDYIASGDFEPTQLTVIQERLDLLFRLKKKYGGTLEDVKEHLNKAQEEYANIAFLDRNLELAGKRKLELEKQMLEKVAALTACRKQVAEKFAKLVTMHIKDLAMEQGVFQASFTLKEECGLQGRDSVEFLFSANLGMEVKPLQKIASGGELSRLALAIKTVLLEKSGVSTMVFDEIDTGVGGVTAQKMAEKIAIISKRRQVLCITHLAQIACFADNHLYITKANSDKSTVTIVKKLPYNQQVEEIMRMTGGTNITDSARKNAVELLAMAAEIKQTL
ncbi:DNA repair protein RecN [bioreactor metagenome]|uniref:DNA repair protein RecN n=1 Tax=bioreactor metagenome TaxID=1076179 RepID=A0A644WDS3_9ZZZZ|nr:DNA repair protein RecN [Acidaminococcaceae bacterium]